MSRMFYFARAFDQPLNEWDVAAPCGRFLSSRGSTGGGPLLSSI